MGQNNTEQYALLKNNALFVRAWQA